MTKKTAAAVRYETKSEASVTRERKQTVIDRELDVIYKAHGVVTVPLVLERASDTKSKLHKYYEWDDGVAAKKYREQQAYQMIQTSKFVVYLTQAKAPPEASAKGTEVRRLVSAFRGEGFRMRNEALGDKDARQVIVERKLAELRSWCRSTVDISELGEIRESIGKLIDTI